MGLIGAAQFLRTVESYRLLWIAGKFGGGKTSLAFYMSEPWLKRGYRLITNGKCVWADRLDTMEFVDADGHLKAIVVLDEGGLEFKASSQVETIAAYAAKMDVIYLLPSFWPPVRRAQVVTAQPLFSFHTIGIPLIVYRWDVQLKGFKDGGYFYWWKPQEIYGIYSRQDPGEIASDIVEFLAQKSEAYRRLHGRKYRLSKMAADTDDLLLEAANTFAEAADSLSLPERKRGHRGRKA